MTDIRFRPARRRAAIAAVLLVLSAAAARAQEPPIRRVGPWVLDLRGSAFKPPSSPQLAASRGLDNELELPGFGLGATAGLHVYPLHWRAITFGIGGEVAVARARQAPTVVAGQTTPGPAVTETFVSAAPQLSLNFRGSNGWSYLSAGIGQSQWQIVPDGQAPSDADTARIRTVNYGGGARWFIKKHLAFSLDVRIWQLDPGQPHLGFPGSPRANLLLISSGISVK